MEERSAADSPTLFLPRVSTSERPDTRAGWTLSPGLQRQIRLRLQLVAITYSLAFFFADVVPTLLMGGFARLFSDVSAWVPAWGSILLGVTVAVVARSKTLSWQTTINFGLVFEIVASYGIAIAQYSLPPELRSQPMVLMVLSPSWVAIWILFYSIVVPAPPHKTLIALLASASAAPVMIWTSLHASGLSDLVPAPMFFTHHVLPYLICVGMAYAGARVVYNLGKDVTRAQELGSYKLIERLGRGGMGEVWRASHRFLARPAAIKFIRTEAIAGVDASGARTLLKRFELEAKATASLTSAHTVNIYDFGTTEDGGFYYVMELLDGLDCDDLVRRFGALPPARAVHLLTQMCESLDEAHARGLIHRDVKPANIYVCRSGTKFDFVKVLDFGLVAHRDAPDADATRLTLPDMAVGTPQFMPPEVALGKAVDGRTDLYALGCVAFWLLTGRPVFSGEGLYEVVSRHLHATSDPPSLHARYAIPTELDALVLECLEKEPDRRPGTARELEARLRAIPLADRWEDPQAETWWQEAGLTR